jgi:hypothetical protein
MKPVATVTSLLFPPTLGGLRNIFSLFMGPYCSKMARRKCSCAHESCKFLTSSKLGHKVSDDVEFELDDVAFADCLAACCSNLLRFPDENVKNLWDFSHKISDQYCYVTYSPAKELAVAPHPSNFFRLG